MYNTNLSLLGGFEFEQYKKRTGYDTIMFARPELHSLLCSHVRPEKILLGKRILSHSQDDHGVTIKCSDGTSYKGDILVGADGAYIADLSAGYVCMVGTTNALNSVKYPALKDTVSHCKRIVANESKYSWSVVTVPDNRECWAVIAQLDAYESKTVVFRNSEWGPESNAAMIKECYGYRNSLGGVMGELMDATPTESISKVFLEDRMFETWHSGRTVLIGDAAHKFLPSAGQGAQSAFQDAVVLANVLYKMPRVTHENILKAFKDYKNQRFGPAKTQMDKSKIMGTMLYGQCNFLPLTENRGTVPVLEQKRSSKCEEQLANLDAVVV